MNPHSVVTDPSIWPEGERRLFVSTQTYALAKQIGVEAATQEFERQCQKPDRNSLPAARMVRRLRELGCVAAWHNAGTTLPKLRSRSAHAAHASECEYWVLLDDDVECDQSTLIRLLGAAGAPDDLRIAVLPCLLRGTEHEGSLVNCVWSSAIVQGTTHNLVRPVARAGCGAMIVTRGALRRMLEHWTPGLCWKDDDGLTKVALFEMVRTLGGEWLGEDYSFCERARIAGVEIFGLVSGVSMHDGRHLQLDGLISA